MIDFNDMFDMVLDTLRKLLYPEEWIRLDLYLSKSELLTLLQVDRNGEIIMSQIADYVNIPMSTATGLVERLVKKGLIERVRSQSDRRIVAIRLTDEGKKLTEDMKGSISGLVRQVLGSLDDNERELLEKIFLKVTGILSKKDVGTQSAEDGGLMRKIEIE